LAGNKTRQLIFGVWLLAFIAGINYVGVCTKQYCLSLLIGLYL
jgi:hypothetical protein